MSYIRSGNNPEGLYVFHSTYGSVEFIQKGEIHFMPPEVYEHLARAYWGWQTDLWDGVPVEFEEGYLKGVHVPTGEKPSTFFQDIVPSDFKIEIGYAPVDGPPWSIQMWEATAYCLFSRYRPSPSDITDEESEALYDLISNAEELAEENLEEMQDLARRVELCWDLHRKIRG